MKYPTAAGFRQALETRLLGRAVREGSDVNRLRAQIAFERFLARLFEARQDLVLKGGYALEIRLNERARTTLDLDLSASLAPARDLQVSQQIVGRAKSAELVRIT